MAETSIEWCDRVWNPVRGCSRVSPGCDNCYAMGQAHRFAGPGKPFEGLTTIRRGKVDWSGRARFVPEMLSAPLSWRKPQRIFVNSMSDLFHESVTIEQIAEVFGVMAVAATSFGGKYVPGKGWVNRLGPHTFQILTKRAKRMRDVVSSSRFRQLVASAAYRHAIDRVDAGWLSQCISGVREWGNHCMLDAMWPLPNVWLGVSVEDQQAADERIPVLLETPAAVRFISAEPLLGPLDLSLWRKRGETRHFSMSVEGALRNKSFDCLLAEEDGRRLSRDEAEAKLRELLALGVECVPVSECDNFSEKTGCLGHKHPGLDWVIAGSESGPGARSMEVVWAESLRDQCAAAGVAFFAKQVATELGRANGDRKGGDPQFWPAGEWPRQFPEVPRV